MEAVMRMSAKCALRVRTNTRYINMAIRMLGYGWSTTNSVFNSRMALKIVTSEIYFNKTKSLIGPQMLSFCVILGSFWVILESYWVTLRSFWVILV